MADTPSPFRKTSQYLAPAITSRLPRGQYDIYPGFALSPGVILTGFSRLAEIIAGAHVVTIDGFGGVLWEDFQARLDAELVNLNLQVRWLSIDRALKSPTEIEALVQPYLGGDDPLFGTRFRGSLLDFFDPRLLRRLEPHPHAGLNILYGTGAALAGWDGLLLYIDVPKNEIQFRSRAGSVKNLGLDRPLDPKPAYKRFYFVDWVVLNSNKAELLSRIDWILDGQRPDMPAFMTGEHLREGLSELGHSVFRVRPWFEPGPWGGQWIQEVIPQLSQDVPNYAWSFELISPENGLSFESDGRLLEVSFDMLMYRDYQAVLGDFADKFGFEFPIRFDFLDTYGGGNLSIQCHPRPGYIRTHFGENYTQDEAYYILDCQPDAKVYLGFQPDIDPAGFRQALEHSSRSKAPLEVDRFVKSVPSHKHDLILIPNGTIHGSGTDNLVLEISATPYIFTFKLYDWLRLDLEGQPRPLNINRAFENLYFDLKGDRVNTELLPDPKVLSQGDGWRILHLPTHAEHFYDVHRLEFTQEIEIRTSGSPHVLNLVEGSSIRVETSNGRSLDVSYAETFLIPAAAGGYRLTSLGEGSARVVKAFLKPEWFEVPEHAWLHAPPDMLP